MRGECRQPDPRRVTRLGMHIKSLLIISLLAACDETPEIDAHETPTTTSAAAPASGDLAAPADVAAPPADAQKTASGLAYKILSAGTGTEHPAEQSVVEVHYTGWTTDGEMFDSSVKRGKPIKFPLTRVIAGWTEGLQLMKKGDKARLWIPEELAYKGMPGKPAGMLVFDVELIDFTTPPPPPTAPADVAAPPADAQRTASGIAYRVLTSGGKSNHPVATDQVTVHYSGWTTDGKLVDSSIPREEPATFPLDGVIAGWTEGVQLMAPGDKYLFWIPEELAYKGKPGAPAGMLVFEVELLDFKTPPKPPAAPADVAAPPASAQKTASGLAYRVIQSGGGTTHPAATDKVKVHYTGWTTDGEMFDSSITRDAPATFPLNRVIAGWTEGVQLMAPGDKYLFWIPEELAYKGMPGKPAGMLVFEVELLEILGK